MTTTTPTTTDEALDRVEFSEDGHVRFFADGELLGDLRRPKFGQLRAFQKALREFSKMDLSLRQEIKALAVEVKEAADDPDSNDDDATELLDRMQAKQDEVNEKLEIEVHAFYSTVFETLADSPLPEIDECPTWIITHESLMQELREHWQTVPFRHG